MYSTHFSNALFLYDILNMISLFYFVLFTRKNIISYSHLSALVTFEDYDYMNDMRI